MSLWIRHEEVNEAAKKVAELMAKEYSWSEEKTLEEIKVYTNYVEKTVAFIK